MKLIELLHNDDLVAIANKCNLNFRQVYTYLFKSVKRVSNSIGNVPIGTTIQDQIDNINNIITSGANLIHTLVTKGSSPSSDSWKGVRFVDKNGIRLATFENGMLADGRALIQFFVSGTDTDTWSSTDQGGLQIKCDPNSAANKIMIFNATSGVLTVEVIDGLHGIEMSPPANNSNNGGVIDFHYNQSTADYTSRIIENSEATLTVWQSGGAFIKRAEGTYNGFRVIALNQQNHETPSSQIDGGGFYIYDKDNQVQCRMFHRHLTSGECRMVLETHRLIGSTNYWNAINIGLDSSGNQVYSVSNPAAFRSAIGAFHTGGGTITGNTTLSDAHLYVKSTNIDRDAVNPSSEQSGAGVKFIDNNGETIGIVGPRRMTDGRIRMEFTAVNDKSSDGTSVYNVFGVFVDRAGTATYQVSNAANFRSAIAEAGTTNATLNTSYTNGGSVKCIRKGNVISVELNGVVCKTYNGRQTIATIPSGYRPAGTTYGMLNGIAGGYFIVNTNGTIMVDSGYGSGKTLYGSVMAIRA